MRIALTATVLRHVVGIAGRPPLFVPRPKSILAILAYPPVRQQHIGSHSTEKFVLASAKHGDAVKSFYIAA